MLMYFSHLTYINFIRLTIRVFRLTDIYIFYLKILWIKSTLVFRLLMSFIDSDRKNFIGTFYDCYQIGKFQVSFNEWADKDYWWLNWLAKKLCQLLLWKRIIDEYYNE